MILIVDDEPTMISGLKSLFRLVDAEVRGFCAGIEALAFLYDHKPTLIILDLNMPQMKGMELEGDAALRRTATGFRF